MNDSANVAADRAQRVGAGLSRDRLWALLADNVEWFALGSRDVHAVWCLASPARVPASEPCAIPGFERPFSFSMRI
jgi:hypothetical protein